MGQGIFLRKYGVETTVHFSLFETDGIDFKVDAAHAAGDTTLIKDEGAEASTVNAFADEGTGYSLVLTATEMQAARLSIYVADQGQKDWLDTTIEVDTYGNASAMHAVDLDDAVRAGLTALPNAAADAAGGLAISDAGGLDLDAQLANTNEVTAARMGALTDWINGGRLDLLLDAVKVVTDALPDAGALNDLGTILTDTNEIQGKLPTNKLMGSSDVADHDTDIDAILVDTNELQTDWVNGGRLDLLIDAIKVITDALPDAGALSDLATILADTNMLQTDWVNGGRLDLLLDAVKVITDALPDAGALSDLATILADTNELQGDWTNTGRLDTILDSILADTNELQTDDIPAAIAALNDLAVTDILADSTAFNGAEMNPATAGKVAFYVKKLMIALVNKTVITEASGNVEQFDDANSTLGSIATGLTSDGTYTTRLRLVK